MELDPGKILATERGVMVMQFHEAHEDCRPVERLGDNQPDDDALELVERLVTAVERLETNVHGLIGRLKQ